MLQLATVLLATMPLSFAEAGRAKTPAGYEALDVAELGSFDLSQTDWLPREVPRRFRSLDGKRVVVFGGQQRNLDDQIYLAAPTGAGWTPAQRTIRLLNPRGLELPNLNYARVGGVLHLLDAREGRANGLTSLWSMDVECVEAPRPPPPPDLRNAVSQLPCLILLALTSGLVIVFSVRRAHRELRTLRSCENSINGLCRCCGYDLRASGLRCPECGTDNENLSELERSCGLPMVWRG